jgi:ribosomal protein S18 acetylase RimI-like enzyme
MSGARDAHPADTGMGPPFSVAPGGERDLLFLREMLYEAAFWRRGVGGSSRPSLDEAVTSPDLALYVDAWGRPGDRALLALHGDRPLGAVWYRLFAADEPGYGFVDEGTPELSIGVLATERGRGVGSALLAAALAQAALDGQKQVSLSVEPDNPALRLYERFGFARLELADGAWTMVRTLR